MKQSTQTSSFFEAMSDVAGSLSLLRCSRVDTFFILNCIFLLSPLLINTAWFLRRGTSAFVSHLFLYMKIADEERKFQTSEKSCEIYLSQKVLAVFIDLGQVFQKLWEYKRNFTFSSTWVITKYGHIT